VALKFLLPSVLDNAQVVHRFAREARAAVQIQSEHVARVIDVGTLPTGSPYMVMEYLEGGDLSEALVKGGAMPVARAVGYLLQACEAIAEAHALGIVHRDLKPANLFLARRAGRDAIVKVLDFGISKTNETATSGLTQTSHVMGSPQYMSPEQMMSSKNVDARADVWALGVILFEMVTGEPPFVAETMAEIVYMVTQRDAPSLIAKRSDLPPALGAAVARALARDPARRYADVAQLALAIAPFGPPRSEISIERIARVLGSHEAPVAEASPSASGSAPSLPPPSVAPFVATSVPTPVPPETSSGSELPPRSRGRILMVAAASALLVGAIGWRALRGRSDAGEAHPAEAATVPPPFVAPAPPSASPPTAIAPSRAPVAAAPPPGPSAPAVPASPPVKAPSPKPLVAAAHSAKKHSKSHASLAAPPTAAARSPDPPPPAPANRGLNMGIKE
jgi:serine/threonine-protein kinase